MKLATLKRQFESKYGRQAAGAVRAPGRVNLIGEHTDYNDGFVMPIAVERQTIALWAPRGDRKVHFASLQVPGEATIDLAGTVTRGEPKWANYCRGVVAGLMGRGADLVGADVLLASDVSLGGGLSSSASLEVATAFVLLAAAGKTGAIADKDLALLCQKAEHDFAGAPCGIMDQSIAIMARAGCALLLDCRDGATRQIPFDDPRLVLLVVDTRIKHDISDGGYALRRDQCYAAAKKLGVRMLREADAGMLGRLTGKELMRARHVIGEIRRTTDAAAALKAGDYAKFGQLMYASHESLRADYEVSCEELDAVVDLARQAQGVYGARMTGGGFGGCAIVLAAADRSAAISDAIASGFEKKFQRPCAIFATRAVAGAQVLE